MMHPRKTPFASSTLSTLFATFLCTACVGAQPEGAGDDEQPDTEDPECQLDSEGERNPGYPFDLQLYADDVLPVVRDSCSASGCHGAPDGEGNFTVWAQAEKGTCDYAKTFNAIADQVDLDNPNNSALIAALDGTNAAHPVQYADGDSEMSTLIQYVSDASERYQTDGNGGDTAPPGASPFDYAEFQATIQPILDNAGGSGCATSGCHGTGAGTFDLNPTPGPDSPEMEENFLAVTARTNLADPGKSIFYLNATTSHAAGASTVVNATEGAAILDWIEKAAEAAGDSGDDAVDCAPVDRFNVGVFRDEIMPILSGDLDLNDVNGTGGNTGCTSGPCHGTDRGPGTLSLQEGRSAIENLESFACFVSLQTPSRSEILACPLNQPGCRLNPHPGQDVFGGADDLNYQRMLAFLFGSRLDATPLDFAFFVRQINPIFNDPEAVDPAVNATSCADTAACHGVSIAGQDPPNGSNFPILPNAAGEARLTFNFVSAASFVNFLDADESSLFLYPTNEIENVEDHPLATGLPHPGGEDFAVDSPEAEAILTWAAGLRPDGQGFQRNWLVAGDYAAVQVSDQTLVDEAGVEPAIFDASGGTFNAGQWDGFFSDQAEVDLNQVFPRQQTNGRVAYAVAYLINTTPTELQVQIQIDTDNPSRVYVGGQLAAQDDDGGGATAIATLAPYGSSERPAVRVLVKLLQRADDPEFAFTAQLRDELGNPLTDVGGELLITLGPDGGL